MYTEVNFHIEAIQHIVERMPNSNWKIEQSCNPSAFILGVSISGKVAYTINGQNYIIPKGGLIFLPPGTMRAAHSLEEDPWHMVSIGCRLSFPDEESRNTFTALSFVCEDLPDSFLLKSLELVHIWNGKRTGYQIKCQSLLLDLFYTLLQINEQKCFEPSYYERITRIQEYIQKNYQKNLKISELAELCSFSESHFRRVFRSVTGISCIQYINLVKIEIARNILLSGTANVMEAAVQAGYSDAFYFSRIFKKITGHSPSDFKR